MIDTTLFAHLLANLNMVVVERLARGEFQILGIVPEWFRRLYPESMTSQSVCQPEWLTPFVENFLIDAECFWLAQAPGQIKSGPWVELDATGQARYLEAAAVCAGQHRILLIYNADTEYVAQQSLLQKAREHSLAYDQLVKESSGNALYQRMVEHSAGLIWAHTLDGTLLSVNQAAAHALGYEPHLMLGQPLSNFVAPVMRHLVDEYLRRLQRTSEDSDIMRVVTKTGAERFWAYRNVLHEDTARPPYVLCHALDVTEHVQMEQALRESETRFRNLVAGSIQGLVVHRDFVPLYANQAYATLFGYPTPDDILQLQSILALFAPHERTQRQHEIEACLRQETPTGAGEYQGLRSDGQALWLEVKSTRITWDGEPAVQTTVIDITERKRAAEQLAQTLTQLAQSHDDMLAILQQLRLGTAMTDEEGQLTFLSHVGERLLDTLQAELLGMSWEHALPFDPKTRAALKAMTTRSLEARTRVPTRLVTAAGRHIWLDIEIRDDPRDPQRKIFLFYDTSEVHKLRRQLAEQAHAYGLVGASEPMRRIHRLIQEVARVDTTVLIEGETGTGKELVARAIHQASPRHGKPFIAVNCGGLSESVLVSQLFGHKRGAFTGAIADHCGLIEAANGGTLFLDEIGDIPLPVQTSLLRTLQEREVTRLGESTPRKINVRILAATHRDLLTAVAEGSFRADLLYRLRVARLRLPALRERREDIILLVSTFLTEYRLAFDKPVQEVSHDAIQRMLDYAWPGNVRELKSAVEFAVLHCGGSVIHPEDLPPELSHTTPCYQPTATALPDERQRLLAAIAQAGGNRRRAARLLGISKSTLYRRLASFGL